MEIPSSSVEKVISLFFCIADCKRYYIPHEDYDGIYINAEGRMYFYKRKKFDMLKSFITYLSYSEEKDIPDFWEIELKKEKFVIGNCSVYKVYGNEIIPIFYVRKLHTASGDSAEMHIYPDIYYDNKSTLFFFIRKYLIYAIIRKYGASRVQTVLFDANQAELLKLSKIHESTNKIMKRLNLLNLGKQSENEESYDILF